MKVKYEYYTDAAGREINEDSMLAERCGDRYLLVVADGLGGEGNGDVASKIVISEIKKALFQSEFSLEKAIVQANSSILREQKPGKRKMKSTCAAVLIENNRIVTANIGDSRVYLFRDGKIAFQTCDHSSAQVAVNLGEITLEQIREHPDRNILTRALGADDEIKADINIFPADAYDHVLICSDGLWEYVTETEMITALSSSRSVEKWLCKLREIHNNAAPRDCDNFTIIVAEVVKPTDEYTLNLNKSQIFGDVKQEEPMFCENCGAPLQPKDNKLVCPKCGAEYLVKNSANAAPPSAETASEYIVPHGFSSKKNIIIIILAAVLVLGLGAGITAIAITNSPSFKVSQGIDLAERYLSEQNYEQAIIEYEKVLEIEPMNVDAYLGLAKAYEKMGEIDKAIEVLREGLEMTGDERIEKRLNKLLNPEESSSSSSSSSYDENSSSSADENSSSDGSDTEDLPHYGSMGFVTIGGGELDIATTTRLELYRATNDDVIEIGKLVNLKSLYLSSNQISDIEALGNLTNLTYLELRGTQISDISSLAKLTQLKYLHLLDNNKINDISPLATLTNLIKLTLFNNQISDISALANLAKLKELDLGVNQIIDISPLVNLTNLEKLLLENNQISNISTLANFNNLTELRLDNNQISDINPLANITNLTELNLMGNQISNISPLANFTNLKYLNLNFNKITNIIPLANLTNLTELYLYYNYQLKVEDKNWLQQQLPNCEIHF